jgi:hypothetical protein
MSYSSAINQQILPQTIYNVSIETTPTNTQSIASIGYVEQESATLSDSIATYTDTLNYLTNEYTTLYNEYQILQAKVTNIIGSVIFLCQDTPPIGYFLCDGSPLDVDTYINLFTVIQYRYGGSGNLFYIPDFRSRFVVGANQPSNVKSNLTSGNGFTGALNTYYTTGGIFEPVIIAMPPHSHIVGDNGHIHAGTLPDTLPFSNVYGPLLKQSTSGTAGYSVGTSQTGITLQTSGVEIQQIDPNSNLAGVNVVPPFLAVNAFICYQN